MTQKGNSKVIEGWIGIIGISDSFKGNNSSETGGIKGYNVATGFRMHEQDYGNKLSSCVFPDVFIAYDKCHFKHSVKCMIL